MPRLNKKKVAWVLGVTLFTLEVGYVAAANYFLRPAVFNSVINPDPLSHWAQYGSAWTVIPGRVYVKDFLLRTQDDQVRWTFELGRADVNVDIFALLFRKFHVTRVHIDHINFRIYRKGPDGGRADKLQAPIKGFAANNPPPDNGPPSPPSRRFRFEFNDITIDHLTEIWINDFNYQGDVGVKGDFFLWPGTELDIVRGELEVRKGYVVSGLDPLVTGLKGSIEGSLRHVSLRDGSSDDGFMHLGARARLAGNVNKPFFLNLYLDPKLPFHFDSVAGDFTSDVGIEKGAFTEGTRVDAKIHDVRATLNGHHAVSEGAINGFLKQVGGKPVLAMKLTLPKMVSSDAGRNFVIGKDLEVEAEQGDTLVEHLFSETKFRIDVPEIKILGLGSANPYLPKSLALKMISGQALVHARLEVSNHWGLLGPSQVSFKAQRVVADWGKERWSGDFEIDAKALRRDGAPENQYETAGTKLVIARASIETSSRQAISDENWTGSVQIDGGTLLTDQPGGHPAFDGRVSAAFSDTVPLLDVVAQRAGISGVVKSVLKLKNVAAQSNVKLARDDYEIDHIQIKSSTFKFNGHFFMKNGVRDLSAVLDSGLFKIDVDVKGDKSSIHFKK